MNAPKMGTVNKFYVEPLRITVLENGSYSGKKKMKKKEK
jgi:hypothetical protein